jgi:HK97 family phage prohead protease
MERRYITKPGLSAAIRADGEGGSKQTLIGHAAVFYDGDEGSEFELWSYAGERCVERVMPGAFARALREADDVRGLYNHDVNCVLGRTTAGTLRLREDSKGLAYECDMPDTQLARDLALSVGRGDVTGSSFSFLPDDQSFREQADEGGGILVIRELNSVRLFDVGPVVFPAYGSATSGLRSAQSPDEARAAYEAWKRGRAATVGGFRAKQQAAARARVVEVTEADFPRTAR